MEQIYNPYLPLTEYIPDGEPHVFGDRVYIYGSHDRAGGTAYCEQGGQLWISFSVIVRKILRGAGKTCKVRPPISGRPVPGAF